MALVLDGTLGLTYTGGTTGSQSLAVPQNIGIGTTSPGARLEIKGDATDNATLNINNNSGNIWKLWNDNGASALNIQYNGSTKIVVDTSGNIYIGATSATWNEKLSVSLGSSTPNANVGLGIYHSAGSGYTGSLIRVQTETTGTGWKMYEGRGQGGGVLYWVDGTGSAYFAGNVWIGSTPSAKLDVTTGDGTATANAVYFRGTTGVFAIYPYFDATNGCLINSYNAAISAYKPMVFQATNWGWNVSGTRKMDLDTNGNLLVGRTSVSGLTASNLSGNIQVSDNIANGSYTIGGFGSFLGRQASDGSTVLNTGQSNIIFSNGAYGSTSTWLSFNSTGVLNSSGRAILKQSGSVIQTLSTTLTTFGTTTSTTYVAVSGLSVTITPSNTSSQVLVRGYLYVTGSAQNGQFVSLFRGGSILTGIIGAAGINAIINGTAGTTRASGGHIPASAAVTYVNIPLYFEYLDSPASTSAQVYQVYIRVGNGSTMYYNYQAQTGTNPDFGYYASTITAQEIAA